MPDLYGDPTPDDPNFVRPRKGRRQTVVRERSAGVLVFRDVNGRREYLLLDYGRHWDYPKGHLEPGETDEQAARRELREETGIIDIELIEGFSREIVYHFRSSRKGLVRKEVIFFAGRLDEKDEGEVMLSEEHVGYSWEERDAALAKLTFENARSVLVAAADHLDASSSADKLS